MIFEMLCGFAQKVEIDAARRVLTVDTASQPAAAGDSIKPGVERSAAEPQVNSPKIMTARGSGRQPRGTVNAVARYRGLAWISHLHDFLCKAPRWKSSQDKIQQDQFRESPKLGWVIKTKVLKLNRLHLASEDQCTVPAYFFSPASMRNGRWFCLGGRGQVAKFVKAHGGL
jgi:hypothetical protein